MSRVRTAVTLLVCTALVGVMGCGKSKSTEQAPAEVAPATTPVALSVTGLDLGKRIDADNKIVVSTSTFGPTDTIYVSVATVGTSPSATLSAKWTFGAQEQLVNQMSQPIAPTGPASTEFHISRPKPWPVGAYKVEVSLDSVAAGSKTFDVKR